MHIRIPSPAHHTLPLLGTIEAGFPSLAEEELSDTLTLDEYLIPNKEATSLLKVETRAMMGAGILPGDIVLVERGRTAKDGDIVIAEVDGDWMMRYLRKRGRTVYLEAANLQAQPIVPTAELRIAAVVIAVIHKY